MQVNIRKIDSLRKDGFVLGTDVKDGDFILKGNELGVKTQTCDEHGKEYHGMVHLKKRYDVPQDITDALVLPVNVNIEWWK